MIKKIISVFLAAVMIFSLSQAAFAAGNVSETVECEIINDKFAVVTYSSVYNQKGEVLKAYSIEENPETGEATAKEMPCISEVYIYDGKAYPQVFIDVSEYSGCFDNLSFKVDAGAFETSAGEDSEEAVVKSSECEDWSLSFYCECDMIVGNDEGVTYIKKDSQIHTFSDTYSSYNDVWNENLKTCFYNSQNELISEGRDFQATQEDTYTVQFILNDFIKYEKTFSTEENSEFYYSDLSEATKGLLLSPINLILSIVGWFVVPASTVLFYAAVNALPNFFKVLFKNNDSSSSGLF